MNITLDEFKNLSRQGNVIPLYKEILGDIETPVSAYLKLNKKPSFLLESVIGGEKWARYSFVGINPSLIISCDGNKVFINERGRENIKDVKDPLIIIKDLLKDFKPVMIEGLPRFSGGLVGYIGYDTVKFFERVPDTLKPKLPMPDIFLMLPEIVLIFDNLKQTIKVVCNAFTDGKGIKDVYDEAGKKIDQTIVELREGSINEKQKVTPFLNTKSFSFSKEQFCSNFLKEDFLKAVQKSKEYVMSGDVVQVVLSQRFQKQTDAKAFDIYRSLRIINPSPYMYYIDIGDSQIVGSSPEILVRLEGDKITLRPIAGTRRRGITEQEDKELEEDLKKDPKEIAEHIMLVDLGRNDVGRVAEIGTVKVTELMAVERYSHVMHLVSNVEGRLKEGLDCFDVFRACFPAGTVTGAPKVRAMEIIEELEPTKRGPYAGAVGYFSFQGNMDMCITIRTLLIINNNVYVQAGAGIVADSNPEKEYFETVNKAMAMMKAVAMTEEQKDDFNDR
jgi:anthranilate synthase component 1